MLASAARRLRACRRVRTRRLLLGGGGSPAAAVPAPDPTSAMSPKRSSAPRRREHECDRACDEGRMIGAGRIRSSAAPEIGLAPDERFVAIGVVRPESTPIVKALARERRGLGATSRPRFPCETSRRPQTPREQPSALTRPLGSVQEPPAAAVLTAIAPRPAHVPDRNIRPARARCRVAAVGIRARCRDSVDEPECTGPVDRVGAVVNPELLVGPLGSFLGR